MDIEYMIMLYQICNKMDYASCQIERYEEVYKDVLTSTEFIQEVDTAIKNYDRGLVK